MKKQIIFAISILSFLIISTLFAILYGKGYRISFKQNIPEINKTGLLVVNSYPNGAQVFIDNHLTTATNNTINLPPGIYDIKIQKEGYFPWQKKLKIETEVVTKTEALLFPVAPRLESIATTPVLNPLIDPSGTKIAYQIASDAASRKNGIYILNMNTNTISVSILTLQSSSTQIADDTATLFSQAKLKWSLDGTQILAQIQDSTQNISTYLLKTDRLNEDPQDVTAILQSVEDSWRREKQQKERSLLADIKENTHKLIADNFSILAWSPDETKILYEASISAQLPLIIKPRRLGIDSLAEKRQITKGEVYVYDTKEDTNMKIPIVLSDSNSQISWLPDSSHLLYINDKKIIIMDTDGSNRITVYAGPFIDTFAVPWPDNSKIVILTNLGNPEASPTLYTIGLK
ncbi:PEGA domain-containing protein [Patescibacteria group bacterium]|nr:PEGA domain-containing protein [Patescibacteria group bacterium]MBU4098520.1 PEGA domain-containing protein [Patescibacteria group bacterium]